MDISVIVPTYYRNNRVRDAIDSALSQTYPPEEIIVVDDSGESHAAPAVQEWDDNERVTYLPLSENYGPQTARERGFKIATGDYVQCLDDDDRLHPKKFEYQTDVLDETSHGVVYSGLELENGGVIRPKESIRGNILQDALALETWPCCMGTMLIDADVYESVTPIDNRAEDHRLRIKLAQQTTFEFINEPLLTVGTDTKDSLGGSRWQYEGMERILSDFSDLYAEYPDAYRRARGQVATNRAQYTRRSELEEKIWSWKAVRESFKAAVLDSEQPRKRLLIAIATLAGRPGIKFGETFLEWLKNILRNDPRFQN